MSVFLVVDGVHDDGSLGEVASHHWVRVVGSLDLLLLTDMAAAAVSVAVVVRRCCIVLLDGVIACRYDGGT